MGTEYSEMSEEEKEFPLVEESPFFKEEELAHHKEKYTKHFNIRHLL